MNEEIFDVVREAVAAAKLSATGVRHLSIRPGTISSVSADSVIAIVAMDDDELIDDGGDDTIEEGGIPAQMIYPTGVKPGDRVAVATVPGGGTFVIGRRGGDYDPWTYVGAVDPEGEAQGPAFGTGWANQTATGFPSTDTHGAAAYRRLGRTVELRGRVWRTSGVGTLIFTLPNWYRPSNRVAIPVVTGLGGTIGPGHITVTPLGQVLSGLGTIDEPSGSIFLDGVMFSVDSGEDEEVP